jgi:hypothetical protein
MRGAELRDVEVTTGFEATFFCGFAALASCGMHAAAINTNKAAPRKADILVDLVCNLTSIAIRFDQRASWYSKSSQFRAKRATAVA